MKVIKNNCDYRFEGTDLFMKKGQTNGGSIEKIVNKGSYMYLMSKDNKDKPLESNCKLSYS